MKLLVTRADTVVVTVYCYEENGEVEATHLKTEVPQNVNVDVVQTVDFTFRKPTYQDSNLIIRNANFKSEGEETSLNVTAFQEQVLKSLLIEWTIEDDDDNKRVPVNNANINNLHPSVARAAVSGALDKIRI